MENIPCDLIIKGNKGEDHENKRGIAMAMSISMVLLSAACGSGRQQNTDVTQTDTQSTEAVSLIQQNHVSDTLDSEKSTEAEAEAVSEISATSEQSEKKILVAYFSWTGENYSVGVIEKGNTHIVADMIAEQTGGDIFEIHTIEPYPDIYNECTEVARREKDENARPELDGSVEGIENYDVVFLGFPIWWGIAAWPVNRFVEMNDFTGKTVIPFCTSASSNLGESGELLAELAGTGNWLKGRRFSSHVSEGDVSAWIDELGLQKGSTGTANIF